MQNKDKLTKLLKSSDEFIHEENAPTPAGQIVLEDMANSGNNVPKNNPSASTN